MQSTLTLLALAIIHLNCGGLEASSTEKVFDHQIPQAKDRSGKIDQATALGLARSQAEKVYGSTLGATPVLCEEIRTWRIFFELKNFNAGSDTVEYVLDKRTGKVVHHHELYLALNESSNPPTAIDLEKDKAKAIAIARADARKAYGSLASYNLTICETVNSWILIFSTKGQLDGGSPEYVIQKGTGKILAKKYFQ
jgi:hypothetical protein